VFLGGTSYSLVQTLLLQDVSFSHNAQHHRQTDGQTDVPMTALKYSILQIKNIAIIIITCTIIPRRTFAESVTV